MDQRRPKLDEPHGSPPPVIARPTAINEGTQIHDAGELSRLLSQSRFSLALHRDLTQLALDGAGVPELTASLARRIDHTVLVENRFLHRLAVAGPPQPPTVGEEVVGSATLRRDANVRAQWQTMRNERRAIRLSPSDSHTPDHGRIVAPIVVAHNVVGYVSILGQSRPIGPADDDMAQLAATAMGVEFVRQSAEVDAAQRTSLDLLDAVLASADTTVDVRGLRSSLLSVDLSGPGTLLLISLDSTDRQSAEESAAPVVLRDLLSALVPWARHAYTSSLVCVRLDHLVVVLGSARESVRSADRANAKSRPYRRPGMDRQLSAETEIVVDDVRQELSRACPDASVSISVAPAIHDWGDLRRTYATTRRALVALELLGERGTTISSVDPRLAIFLLLDGTKPDTLQEFVDLVLGPLRAYDLKHSGTLVPTLASYIEHGGQLEMTARALSIHASTLKYRLQRLREVGGIDPRNADHRFNAALALRLLALEASWT